MNNPEAKVPAMMDAILKTRSALTTADRLSVRAETAVGGWRLAARAAGLLLIVMALDVFFPLTNLLRGFFMIGLTAWVIYRVCTLRARMRGERLRLERAARLLESRHPELENALINALQFSEKMDERSGDPSTALMRREMARAELEAERLSVDDAVDMSAIKRARLPVLLIACLVLLTVVLIPRFWRFEVPRFLLFGADLPPFTLTDFHVSPRGAHVKYGGSVAITVKVGGLMPESLTLVTQTGRQPEQNTPLYTAETGVYKQTLENLTDDTRFYVRANTGRSARYLIAVDQAPRVQRIRLTIHPPAYTRSPVEMRTLDKEGIGGLFGTQVDVEVEATRPLEEGRLVLSFGDAPEEVVTLEPEAGRPDHAGGSFAIRRDGRFRLDLTAADGLRAKDAARGPVHLLRDQKPLVYITTPGMNAVVTPDMTVPIRVEAEDDVALQRVELHRIVNNMTDSARTLDIPAGRRRADATAQLDFKDLGARPGDIIQYYASAYDNDPGKPNITDSDRYWLWVVSQEDYRRLLSQQRGLPQLVADYRAQTDALKSLAAEQRALAQEMAKLAERPNDLQQAQRGLRQKARELAGEMRKLAGQKPQYDIEKGLQKKLSELAKQVEQAAKGAMKEAETAPAPGQMAAKGEKAAQQLERASGQGQQSIEKALQALEKLAPLYQDVMRLRQLAQKQGEMAMQARQVARQVRQDEFSKSRLAQLAQQQEQARHTARQIQQDLQDHAGDCRGIAPGAAAQAEQLAAALDKMGVADTMQSAERAFREPDAQTGAEQAERAQHMLESFFRQGKACRNGAQQGLDSQAGMCLGQGAGDTLDQLSRMMGQGQGGEGQGTAMGQGGQPAPQPGTRPGDGSSSGSGQQATALTLRQQQSGSSTRRQNRAHFPGANLPGALGQEDVERLSEPSRKPASVADSSEGRYPVEYRKLVKDYFKAVAGGK
jgi:hypothetical protein